MYAQTSVSSQRSAWASATAESARRAPVPRCDPAALLVGFGTAVTVPVETDTAFVVEAEEAEAAPELPMAFERNAEKVLPVAGAFTAKTMPDSQWLLGLVCLQYTQIGAVYA